MVNDIDIKNDQLNFTITLTIRPKKKFSITVKEFI